MKKDNTYILRLLFPLVSFIFHFTVWIFNFFLTFAFLSSSGITFYIYTIIYPCYIDSHGVDCTEQVFNSMSIDLFVSILVALGISFLFRKRIDKNPFSLFGIIGAFIFLNVCIRFSLMTISEYIFLTPGFIQNRYHLYFIGGLFPSILSIMITYFILKKLIKVKKIRIKNYFDGYEKL